MVYEEKYDQPVPPSHKKVVWPKVNKKTNNKKRTNNKKNKNNKKKSDKGIPVCINPFGPDFEIKSDEEEEEAFSADSDDSSYSP